MTYSDLWILGNRRNSTGQADETLLQLGNTSQAHKIHEQGAMSQGDLPGFLKTASHTMTLCAEEATPGNHCQGRITKYTCRQGNQHHQKDQQDAGHSTSHKDSAGHQQEDRRIVTRITQKMHTPVDHTLSNRPPTPRAMDRYRMSISAPRNRSNRNPYACTPKSQHET